LSAKVALLKEKKQMIDAAKEELSKLEEQERILSREEIPQFLMSKGITSITTEDGVKVEVQQKISVSMPKKDLAKRNAALKWLIVNGGEAIINNELRVTDPERSVTDFLHEQGIPFTINKDVHYGRLKSFVSAKLGLKKGSLPELEASDIPEELNLYTYDETKLS
jgi:hypothetical protein